MSVPLTSTPSVQDGATTVTPTETHAHEILTVAALGGATAQQLADAEQLLACGHVLETVIATTDSGSSFSTFVGVLKELVKRVADHQSLTSMVTMAEQIEAERIQADKPAEPGHYPWCHDHDRVGTHLGTRARMPIPEGMDCRNGDLLSAQLSECGEVIDPEPDRKSVV